MHVPVLYSRCGNAGLEENTIRNIPNVPDVVPGTFFQPKKYGIVIPIIQIRKLSPRTVYLIMPRFVLFPVS